jgi:rhodanese-related sulfurtransferase
MKLNFKTVFAVIVFSSVLGLVINAFSTKGIPLVGEKKSLTWADDLIFNGIDSEDSLTEETAAETDSDKSETVPESTKEQPVETAAGTEPEKEPEVKEPVKEEKTDETPLLSEPAAINIRQAYRFYQQKALFIDAREPADFNYAHIDGALNIPFDHFDDYKHLLNDIDKNRTIVTYCGGTDCDLSILLGNLLFEMGYKRTFIFFGGWNDWLEAEYPVVYPE